MKKIMFYTMSLEKGGAERVISNLANELIKKYKVTIVTNIKSESEYKLDSSVKHIKIDKTTSEKKINKIIKKIGYYRTKKLCQIVEQEKPDIIIAFLPEPSFRILKLKNKIKTPIIISDRNDPNIEYKGIVLKNLMKKRYKKADGFIFQTKEAKEYFNSIIKCKSEVIYNAINKEFIIENPTEKRKKTIVSVGRLEKQKNHKLLIDAFEKFNKKDSSFELEIYGEGKLQGELKKMIESKGLNLKVHLMGKTDNVKKSISDASMFILSSDYEGMPNVLLEAMSMGIPCISTNCPIGGPKSIIKNEENGLLVETNNSEQLCEAMIRMSKDEELLKRIYDNHKAFLEEFDEKTIYKKWENYIENMIK